jgi:hypothetical protein
LILIGLYNTRVLEGFETSSDTSTNTNTKKEEKKPGQPVQVNPSDDKVSAVTADSKDAVIYPNDDNSNSVSDDTETSATSTPAQVVDSQPVENEIDSTTANVSDTTVSTEGFSNMGKQNNNMNQMLNTYKQMIPKDSNSLVYYKVPSSKEASAFEGFTTTTTKF